MDLVWKYIAQNEAHVQNIFSSMSQNNKLPAAEVFNFLKNAFNQQQFRFEVNGRNFFEEDDNSSTIQKIIESYYQNTHNNESNHDSKFSIYRTQFSFEEIKNILKFWLWNQIDLKVVYIEGKNDSNAGNKGTVKIINPTETIQMSNKINGESINYQQINNNTLEQDNEGQVKQEIQSPRSSTKKGKINYKGLFEYYAKRKDFTGINATFQRIDRETQNINYQKFAHFLKEYDLMPNSTQDRKKVYNIYLKNSILNKYLDYNGFVQTLDAVADFIFENKPKQDRLLLLKQKLSLKRGKSVNTEINYSFKLRPQDGKFVNEVTESLQKRRQEKQSIKIQKQKIKQRNNLRYLKKLSSIDPFNPQVIKNASILQAKPKPGDPIASFENIEKYRDHSFDFHRYLGINGQQTEQQEQERIKKDKSLQQYESMVYNKSRIMKEQMIKLQKAEEEKMNNLMSGILKRSNAKLQRMGLSPLKREKSVKI